MHFLRWSILVETSLLFALSVILLGLICRSLAYVNSVDSKRTGNFTDTYNTADANGFVNGTAIRWRTFAYLPTQTDSGSYWIIFAAGLGGVLDSLLILFFVVRRSPISIIKVCRSSLRLTNRERE